MGQTVGVSTTNYALDIASGLPEVIYTSQSELYLHLPGVIVTQKATEIRYLLSDGLGSIRHAVDETATVVAYQEFDPYGNPVAGEGDPYGYTGEWWEDAVGLLHLRARWYLPETGTFLSVDPVESEPPYQYVRGNVVNLTDPSGKFPPFPSPPGHVYGPSVQPDWDVCTTWPGSGYYRELCNQAYQSGDLDAMETIYREIAAAEQLSSIMPVASAALRHFLNGTTSPGKPLYLPRFWYLSSSVTRSARNELKQQVIDEINKFRDNCQCNIPPENPIKKKENNINIDPYFGGIPSDIQATIGSHTLNVNAHLSLNYNES